MKTLKVSVETKQKLDKRRHQGQTYDGIIRELLAEKSVSSIKDGVRPVSRGRPS